MSGRPEAKRVTPTDVAMVERAEVCSSCIFLVCVYIVGLYYTRNCLEGEQRIEKKSLRLLSKKRQEWILLMSTNSSGEI